MEKEIDVLDILKNIGSLTGDTREATLDAITDIITSRAMSGGGGGGGMPIPPVIKVDPRLNKPQPKGSDSGGLDDIDFDDPENLLKGSDESDSESEDSGDEGSESDVPDLETSGIAKKREDDGDTKSGKSSKSASGEDEGSETGTEGAEDTEGEESETAGKKPGDKTKPTKKPTSVKPDDLGIEHSDEGADDTEGSEGSEGADEGTEGTEDDSSEDVLSDDTYTKDTSGDSDIETAKKRDTGVGRKKHMAGRAASIGKSALSKLGEPTDAETKAMKDSLEKKIAKLDDILSDDKKLAKTSAEELNELMNDILDIVDKLTPLTYVKDNNTRVSKIKQDLEDISVAREMEAEDAANDATEQELIKAREDEKKRLSTPSLESIKQFELDFKNAIESEVDELRSEVEEDTWSALNRRWEGTPVVRPGSRIEDIYEHDQIIIDVYIDRSGSWDKASKEKALEAVSVINYYTDPDNFMGTPLENEEAPVKLNIYYFNTVLTNALEGAERGSGSRECWDYCINNMKKTGATNVVFVTDSDIEYDYSIGGCHGCIAGPHLNISGHVWWIWKNNSARGRSTWAPRCLTGDKGYSEYYLR